jgi:hypothetical protein
MDRALIARADFLNTLKRKVSASPTSTPTDPISPSSIKQPKDTRQDHGQHNNHLFSTTNNKRRQMGLTKASKAEQASAHQKSQIIIRFYDPSVYAKDALNRQLHEILAWPDSQLERSHNFIQMLFPLPEGSPFNVEVSFRIHPKEQYLQSCTIVPNRYSRGIHCNELHETCTT